MYQAYVNIITIIIPVFRIDMDVVVNVNSQRHHSQLSWLGLLLYTPKSNLQLISLYSIDHDYIN